MTLREIAAEYLEQRRRRATARADLRHAIATDLPSRESHESIWTWASKGRSEMAQLLVDRIPRGRCVRVGASILFPIEGDIWTSLVRSGKEDLARSFLAAPAPPEMDRQAIKAYVAAWGSLWDEYAADEVDGRYVAYLGHTPWVLEAIE